MIAKNSCQGIEVNIINMASQVFIIIGPSISWAQIQTDYKPLIEPSQPSLFMHIHISA